MYIRKLFCHVEKEYTLSKVVVYEKERNGVCYGTDENQ